MNNIKWISIATDVFNDEKMCAIESLPDGLSIELVWFKLLCLAGTCNENGFLMISKDIPYTDEMMAKNFRMEIGLIQRSLDVFQKMGMIEIVENIYMISNWMKYQNTAELDRIKNLNKARQQRFRDKQKQLALTDSNVTNNVTNNVKNNVTSNAFCSICNMSFLDIYKDIINYLNEKAETNYKHTTKKTQTLIHARVEEGFVIDDFHTVIDLKVKDWKGTDMEQYLRPETLFGTKFEGYLNQRKKKKEEVPDKYSDYEKVTLDDM